MVAGGLAIMKQLFRDQLSNTELVTRLFETADRSGVYADAAIYGRSSMDLGAATSPAFPRNRVCQNPIRERQRRPKSSFPPPLRHSRESGNPGGVGGTAALPRLPTPGFPLSRE